MSNLAIDGDVSASGHLGFLGVDMKHATLAVDPDAEIAISLLDPGTDAADGLIRVPELEPESFSQLFSVNVKGDPTDGLNDDLVLNGTFGVSATLPGVDSNIHLADADVTLAWANLADPTSVHVSASSSAGQSLINFLKVGAQDVLTELKGLRDQLDQLAHSDTVAIDIPFAGH